MICPVLAGGNSVTVLLSQEDPRPALLSIEAAANNFPFPPGLINFVSGERSKLLTNKIVQNLNYDAIYATDETTYKYIDNQLRQFLRNRNISLKEIYNVDWIGYQMDHLYHILDFQKALEIQNI